MNKNRKLQNFLIYPQFQIRLILIIMAIALIAPVMILCFQTYSFHIQIQNGQMMNLPETHPYFVFYNEFQQRSFFVFSVSLGITFVLALLIGLVVSHRIAGPLVKMKNHFLAVGPGGETDHPIYFRDGDFFRDLAETYNLKFKNQKK